MSVKVQSASFEIKTTGENQIVDITEGVKRAVADGGVSSGVATVFVVGSTAAVTTMEFEPGLVKDFPAMLERAAPKKGVEYEHQKMWRDGNGHSHVKASLVGPSISIPIVDEKMVLGEWQQLVLVELDVSPRTRKVVVQMIGEQRELGYRD